MTSAEYIKFLWQQYLSGKATGSQLEEIYTMVQNISSEKEIMDALFEELQKYTPAKEMEDNTRFLMLEKILEEHNYPLIYNGAGSEKDRSSPVKWFSRRKWLSYAAAVFVLMAGAGLYFWNRGWDNNTKNHMHGPRLTKTGDIMPGDNRATLTLSDGSTIILDNASNGSIVDMHGIKVLKQENGQLVYVVENEKKVVNGKLEYNTISTPKGGQYQLVLSDGTHIWLNAASSVRFPAIFSGNIRDIEMTGEIYLEVAKDAGRPFFVKAGAQNIEVLGTGFNINAYEDENVIKTTLLSGSIKINYKDSAFLLQPGTQSVIGKEGIDVVDADINSETAWKNGMFHFAEADIQYVMRQLRRWYDINIVYSGKIPAMKFSGEIQKGLNLKQVLEILEESEVSLKLEGRTLTVMH